MVPPDTETFQPNLSAFEGLITEKTKAVIVNTPNNPTGVVYSEETLKALSEILERKEQEIGHPIYLISDEPYRELVYGDAKVSWIPSLYPQHNRRIFPTANPCPCRESGSDIWCFRIPWTAQKRS